MTQQILALCRAMGAAQNREELLLPMAQAVEAQLGGRLKEGVAPEDCGTAFPIAAAMMVMDRLSVLTNGGDGVTSFTAGELTVRRETGTQGEKSLTRLGEELLAPWLGTVGFAFFGVAG